MDGIDWPEGAANPQLPALLAIMVAAAAMQVIEGRMSVLSQRSILSRLPSSITAGAIGVYSALPSAWLAVHYLFRSEIGSQWNMPLVNWYTKAPHTIVTHIFVHASDAHLFTNLGGYVLGCVGAFAAIKRVRELSIAAHQPAGQRVGGSWGDNFTTNVRVVTDQPEPHTHTAYDALVTVGGALVGGILGGALGTATMALYQKENFVSQKGFGWDFLDRHITRPLYTTFKEDSVSCLGGSDVVSGLMGFVQGALGAYSSLGVLVSTDVVWILMEDIAGPPPTWGSLFDRAMKVGHAAHVGGAVGGFVLGLAYRSPSIARRPTTQVVVVSGGRSSTGGERIQPMGSDPFAQDGGAAR